MVRNLKFNIKKNIKYLAKRIYFIFKYVHVYVSMGVSTCRRVPSCMRGQKKELDLQKLELQVAVCFPMWVLISKLGSSTRVSSALNCRTISAAP